MRAAAVRHDAGRPALYDYGMTVEDGATQYLWAHDAINRPRWPFT
ncbi:hypothetical protein [Streptomyces flavofungini]|nr:hypothetical protein [Streptomyces flavofungini]